MTRPRPGTIAAQQATPRLPTRVIVGWGKLANLEDLRIDGWHDDAWETINAAHAFTAGMTVTLELDHIDIRTMQLLAGLPRHRNPYDEWLDYPTAYAPRHRAERTTP